MKIFIFKSIKTRMISWFLFISIIPLVIILVITYNQRIRVLESQTFDKLTAIRDLKVERLNDWLGERIGDMHVLSMDTDITDLEYVTFSKEYLTDQSILIDRCRVHLNRYLEQYPSFTEFSLINALNGRIIASTKNYMEGEDLSGEEYFKEPIRTRELAIKDIYYSKYLSKNTMAYSIPIFCREHNGKHISSILLAHIDLSVSLYELLMDRVGLGKTGETLIVNNEYFALNELLWYPQAPLKLRISAKPAVLAADGESGILSTKDYRGESVLAAFTYIPEMKWGFVCKQDLYELNKPIRDMILNFIVIFIICCIVIYFLALSVGNSITKPIIDVDLNMLKIKEGDLSERIEINSKDEIGSLSNSINEMTESLAKTIQIQHGVKSISETIIKLSSMDEYGQGILKKIMEITGAEIGVFYTLNKVSLEYEHFFSIGANKELLKPFSSTFPVGEMGHAIQKKSLYHLKNIPEDSVYKFQTFTSDIKPREIITIPILIDNIVISLISLATITHFDKSIFDILEQSRISLNSSYSSLIANERTRNLAENLSDANFKLENQSEELQNQKNTLQLTSVELQEKNVVLQQKQKEVEESNRLKSEFLSNMSHELRTPLNSILALSKVLLLQATEKLNDEEKSYLEIVERNGKQLLALINDILDLSKIEAGRIELSPTSFTPSVILGEVRDTLEIIAREKGIVINLDIPEMVPMIVTDKFSFNHILTNIIGNAVKFTEKGEVNIVLDNDEENIFIRVEDTGIGIPETALPYIFDEFRQVDGSASRKYEGTGLGLSIAGKMVTMLGGEIDVESIENIGSIFRISLPLKWESDVEVTKTPELSELHLTPFKKKILVVDDNMEMVKEISDYLEDEGYQAFGTISGKNVVKLAEEIKPFAITLDIIMTDMDGWEVLQHLKENENTKHIPVIIVSIKEEEITGFVLGAVSHLQKPISKSTLLAEIYNLQENPNVVMIVDDNEQDRNNMAEILNKGNITTILAESGDECLKLLKVEKPDILVIDLIMPEIDGFQLIDYIRRDKNNLNLPIVIVSAKDITERDTFKLKGKISSIVSKGDVAPILLYNEIKQILHELDIPPK